MTRVDDFILIVDDDSEIRTILSDLLADVGRKVVALPNGKVALEYLRQGSRPCLILLDLMMPEMDGETFRKAQLGDPALRDIPVVIVTAAGRGYATAVPADAILQKPVPFDSILRTIERFCPSPVPPRSR